MAAGAGVLFRGLDKSADANPFLKLAVSAALIIVEMPEVSRQSLLIYIAIGHRNLAHDMECRKSSQRLASEWRAIGKDRVRCQELNERLWERVTGRGSGEHSEA